jgi:hypothetical protein
MKYFRKNQLTAEEAGLDIDTMRKTSEGKGDVVDLLSPTEIVN